MLRLAAERFPSRKGLHSIPGSRSNRILRLDANQARKGHDSANRDDGPPCAVCFWSRRRDSNSQPPAYEAGALPLSYFGLRRDYIRDGSLSKASRASSFGVSTQNSSATETSEWRRLARSLATSLRPMLGFRPTAMKISALCRDTTSAVFNERTDTWPSRCPPQSR